MSKQINIAPQAGPQEMAAASTADIAFYGGSAGAGKSWYLTYEAARYSQIPGFTAVMFRRTAPEITGGDGSLWGEAQKLYRPMGGTPREGHNLDWRFSSGASILYRHLQYEKDVHSHQGKAYAFIGFDELTHFTEKQFWYMVSRNRTTCGVRPYIRATCNPDPESFVAKMIEWWIDQDGYPIQERAGKLRWFVRIDDELMWADEPEDFAGMFPHIARHDLRPKSFTFIPAKLEDNAVLMKADPQYRANLLALPLVDREQLLGGNWHIRPAAGLYFQRGYFETLEDVKDEDIVRTVRAWDKAATEPHAGNRDPDYTVGAKLAKLKDGSIVIMHIERFRHSPGKVDKRMLAISAQDGKETTVGIFQDPGQAGKVDIEHMKTLLKGYRIRVQRASSHGSKIQAAGPVSAASENGKIYLLRGAWNEAFLREAESFPKGHDDQVDAVSLAYKFLQHSPLFMR